MKHLQTQVDMLSKKKKEEKLYYGAFNIKPLRFQFFLLSFFGQVDNL